MKTFSQLRESLPSKTIVFAFGRFNPPTTGHMLLVNFVKKVAQQLRADHVIYASRTTDKVKNPLPVDRKLHYLNLMFPGINFVGATDSQRTFIEAVKALNSKYKNLVMVAGSDRVPEYQRILNQYNGKEFKYNSIKVMSAGERDPDSDDVSGMSATKMRELAAKGKFTDYIEKKKHIKGFKSGLPVTMRDIDGKRLMNDVRVGMGLEPIKEQLNIPTNELREKYIKGEIFNIGESVTATDNTQLTIVKRGTNYLLCKTQTGQLVSKWIHEVKTTP